MRTWLNEILAVSPTKNNDMSFKNLFYNTQKSRQRNIFNPKSRDDVAGKITDDDKCSMVFVSVSSLQVAVIIHNNYCIINLHHEDFKMWQKEVSFSLGSNVTMKYVCQVESISPYRRMPQSNISEQNVPYTITINQKTSERRRKSVRMQQCIDDPLIQ